MIVAAPYEPRPLRFLRLATLGDWRLKVYGISLAGRAARPELVEATVELAGQVVPPPSEAVPGVGFVIAHDAAGVCFGLVYWWQSENELHQRSHMAPHDDPTALERLPDQAAGCVWELGIIDFERRAWMEDVLANPAGPDLERYLRRRLDADV
ncbi:MAG: isochorismatase [Actinobacteria bacterium]|nr:isochorismatase [Actinomycetota bacterium]